MNFSKNGCRYILLTGIKPGTTNLSSFADLTLLLMKRRYIMSTFVSSYLQLIRSTQKLIGSYCLVGLSLTVGLSPIGK